MLELTDFPDPAALAASVRAAVLPPPPDLSVSEWADAYRVMGPEETSEPGRWKTSRVPHLKAIMDAFSDDEVRTIVIRGSARSGKTEALNNMVGYAISQDPCPILWVFPTDSLANDHSKEKLEPMLKNTPCLAGKIHKAKSRDSNNTLLRKRFEGGYLALVGSNTPNSLSSRTVRVVILDEVDKIAKEAKNLGNPIALAKNRTITYPGRYKHVLSSTPSTDGESPITQEYEASNQQRLYLPCPHCAVLDVLEFANLKWPEGRPAEAYYQCPHCHEHITEQHKSWMLENHEWRAEHPECGRESLGFTLSALFSPWVSFGELAKTFVARRAEGPESQKVFINEYLGLNWKPNLQQEAKVEGMMARVASSPYKSGEVPDGVAALFASVDVQEDRLELLVCGLGLQQREWTISHVVLEGNPGADKAWDNLQDWILRKWKTVDGRELRIERVCLDLGGHFGTETYAFTRRPKMIGIATPIHGSPRFQAKPVKRTRNKRNWAFYSLDTVQLKDTVLSRVRVEDPALPGYQSYPNDLPASYFQQLFAEKKNRTGRYEKVKAGARNETLDLTCYALAAQYITNLPPEALERRLKGAQQEVTMPAKPKQKSPRPPKPAQPVVEEDLVLDPEPEPKRPAQPAQQQPASRPEEPRRPQRVIRNTAQMWW